MSQRLPFWPAIGGCAVFAIVTREVRSNASIGIWKYGLNKYRGKQSQRGRQKSAEPPRSETNRWPVCTENRACSDWNRRQCQTLPYLESPPLQEGGVPPPLEGIPSLRSVGTSFPGRCPSPSRKAAAGFSRWLRSTWSGRVPSPSGLSANRAGVDCHDSQNSPRTVRCRPGSFWPSAPGGLWLPARVVNDFYLRKRRLRCCELRPVQTRSVAGGLQDDRYHR